MLQQWPTLFDSAPGHAIDRHVGWLGRFVHLPVVGRYAQRAFLTKLEDIAVMALAFCHSHEITLRDLEMYGILQVSPPTKYFSCLLQSTNYSSTYIRMRSWRCMAFCRWACLQGLLGAAILLTLSFTHKPL